ncbi:MULTISPECIES: hypothetical protein [unclassified Neptuniibacter]|uniref:hypothetical protein n=1 Tax=unclassified Neptuniibacter TaxID=2630693 RepID=UPI000C3A5F3E|nr:MULTISPECIES: hypothetical protein [unclassified Neptuniibacter]MAY42522.1 hypothetical protein [Oceanospirillaceae bacterium]|tara:strand:+ start:31793 stop:32050 length:258 start_codon:yes stop_codon:yes gene_type:complete
MNLARKSDQVELLKKCMIIPYRSYDGGITDIHLVTLAILGRYKSNGLSNELIDLLAVTKKIFFLQWVFSLLLISIPVINKNISGG